jgi:hypothetical protein
MFSSRRLSRYFPADLFERVFHFFAFWTLLAYYVRADTSLDRPSLPFSALAPGRHSLEDEEWGIISIYSE